MRSSADAVAKMALAAETVKPPVTTSSCRAIIRNIEPMIASAMSALSLFWNQLAVDNGIIMASISNEMLNVV